MKSISDCLLCLIIISSPRFFSVNFMTGGVLNSKSFCLVYSRYWELMMSFWLTKLIRLWNLKLREIKSQKSGSGYFFSRFFVIFISMAQLHRLGSTTRAEMIALRTSPLKGKALDVEADFSMTKS